jgi:hypothetical protein
MDSKNKISEGNIKIKPGTLIPWEQRKTEYPQILGDAEIVRKNWEYQDLRAFKFVFFILNSF